MNTNCSHILVFSVNNNFFNWKALCRGVAWQMECLADVFKRNNNMRMWLGLRLRLEWNDNGCGLFLVEG